MSRNLGSGARNYDVRVTVAGVALKTGDVVTGDDVDDIVVENGIIQFLLEPALIAEQRGAGHLKRWNSDEYQYALDPQYGDYTYFTNTPSVRPQVTVIEATETRAELAIEWPAYDLTDAGTFPNGIAYRDWDNGLNYAQGQSNPNWKYITETRLVKTVIVKRGDEGYFVGYHSDPLVGPVASNIPADNNENASFGERELGLGINWQRVFSSAGVEVSNPEAGGHSGLGIDDPSGLGGAEQADGPWWVGALPDQDAVMAGLCSYCVLRQPLQILDYQFGASANGTIVCLGVNEARDEANVPYRTMLFFGSFPYEVSDMAQEPTGTLKGTVARKAAALDWAGT